MTHVAVVGAGPSGIFATTALLKRDDVRVDVFDRTPTPFGLVRYGVAPDHLKIKSVVRTLHKTMSDPRVTFRGNVTLGRDLTLDDLDREYAAVVLATGAPRPRRLGIPGEDLPGHVSAGTLVDWYNGRPAAGQAAQARRVVVIGAGNVALDIARVLLRGGGLAHTDVTDAVLHVLNRNPVREVRVLVRGGVADTKFTPAELLELDKLADLDIVVDPGELTLTEDDRARCETDRTVAARVEAFRRWSTRPRTGAPRSLTFRFRQAAEELTGTGRVEQVRLRGGERVPADLVVSAIGYRGEPLAGVPFDPRLGRIPHVRGRVGPGLYVTGWAKRGPSGVIGTNKACAIETVEGLLADLPVDDREPGIDATLAAHGTRVVTWRGWLAIDAAEIALGAQNDRTRTKIADLARLVEIGTGGGPTWLT
ncbi:FAD-dependent oxidoreductase [Amycolatopsis sp. K13G38]|uniref:ferredoxin--NADP(+) reductase n=1 Tax=Amycolatopsis acididurans TaxID=2724524 RepID=A0ABX1JH81_9PSEU|nr:FAD-dependent oxidoreductase [Amycolatopsis acididurans]NKQ57916.1 FAD-dependent oxidoreductase [Amycolatopsis acididurans]